MEAAEHITLDVSTVTLGEWAQAELASGLTMAQLLKSHAARKMLAMFVHELRHSEKPRSWSELSSLRLLDVSQSTLSFPSAPSPSTTPND